MIDIDLAHNVEVVRGKIRNACARAKRTIEQVRLVAVSKKQSVAHIAKYLESEIAHGRVPELGENYIQEFKKKSFELGSNYIKHLIGPLQSNKVRDAVNLFDLIHSVQRRDILELINQCAEKIGKVQEVLLQINISEDEAKSGFMVEEVANVIRDTRGFSNVKICGLMAITRLYEQPEEARGDFAKLRQFGETLRGDLLEECQLSMGMSQDFEVAIEEGATLVRVGSAIFGQRD